MSKLKPLNEREWKLSQAMAKNGLKPYPAARAAGYAEATAITSSHKIAARPHVQAAIQTAYKRVEEAQMNELCMTITDKAMALQSIIDDVMPKDGSEPRRELYKDAIKAIQELNKMAGHYAADHKRVERITIKTTLEKLDAVRRVYDEY